MYFLNIQTYTSYKSIEISLKELLVVTNNLLSIESTV